MPTKKKRNNKPLDAAARARSSPKARPKGRAGRKLGPKTLFVLSQPTEIPAAEVVKVAADQGVKLTAALVHTIRSRHRGRSADSEAPPRAMPADVSVSRSSHTAGAQYPSASAFVREQPLNRPVKEVVAAADKIGLKVTANLVRIVRHKMRKAAGTNLIPFGLRAVRRGRPVTSGRGAVPDAAEVQFRQLVFQLGINRAKELVAGVDQAIAALISGG